MDGLGRHFIPGFRSSGGRGLGQEQSFSRAFAAFAQALSEQDLRRAFAFGGPAFKAVTSPESFQRQYRALIQQLGDIVSVKQGETIIEGKGTPKSWVAVTRTVMSLKRGTVSLTYEFHLEEGIWASLRGSTANWGNASDREAGFDSFDH